LCKMDRKRWFSRNEDGDGGIWAVVPMASADEGGEVGRRVSKCPVGALGSSNT
jgi:hypothetical protein